MKRITYRDIASATGYSVMTVSLALRNHRSIREKTRKYIQTVAIKLGYRPDPILNALNVYRHANSPVYFQASLAWINCHPNRYFVRSILEYDNYYRGAEKRASELGYTLEEFWLREPGLTPERLAKILLNRRIQGLILSPAPYGYQVELPWDKFCTIALGFSHPAFHHIVTNAQYRSMRLAVRSLRKLGYERIGSYASWDFSERTDWNFMAGYMAEMHRQGLRPHYLQLPEGKFYHDNPSLLAKWAVKTKIEAVIATDQFIVQGLNESNIEIGKKIAIAGTARGMDETWYAGINQNPLKIGQSAVDQLVGLLQRNELGLSATPMRVLIDGTWMDGLSAPGKIVVKK